MLIVKSLSFSNPCFMATNSAPNTEVSMAACFLETQLDQETSARASGPFVHCMVTVTHHADINVFA
jgi:hypothetical protein